MSKLCEAERRLQLFNTESVEDALGFNCCESRLSYCCPNDYKCKDKFNRSEGPKIVMELRCKIFFHNPVKEAAPSLSQRRTNFVNLLRSMSKTDDGKIVFCVGDIRVCKSYFKVSLQRLMKAITRILINYFNRYSAVFQIKALTLLLHMLRVARATKELIYSTPTRGLSRRLKLASSS